MSFALDWISARYRKSVYFFALHKGGSSVMEWALSKSPMRHLNFAQEFAQGQVRTVEFPERGCVIGPLRLSAKGNEGDLVHRATADSYLKDKRAIVMIRDPRDILVSAYFSFGYSHTLSENEDLREWQIAVRDQIRDMTIDEYAIDNAPQWVANFERVELILREANESQLLTYREMILDFPVFARKLRNFVPLSARTLRRLHDKTRPRETEAIGEHKRSGQVGEFREKLQSETIARINEILAEPLIRFNYL